MNDKITYFQSRYETLRGANDKEVFYEARQVFRKYDNKRRLPYVRSKYFNGQKVFLNMFYRHLNEKSAAEHRRRIIFVRCAIDLIKNSMVPPVPPGKNATFDGRKDEHFRFQGMTKSGVKFAVQIACNKKNNHYFMSCFPIRKFKNF
jgi:hypothetical protein